MRGEFASFTMGLLFALIIAVGSASFAGHFYDSSGGGSFDGDLGGNDLQDTSDTAVNVLDDILLENAAGPAVLNEAASATNPTLLPNRSDADTGIGAIAAGYVSLVSNSYETLRIYNTAGTGTITSLGTVVFSPNGPYLRPAAASLTVPNIHASSDTDSGLGAGGADQVDLIAGGVNGIHIGETGSAITTMRIQMPQADCAGTCTVGDICIDNATTIELCYCQATNTWYCTAMAAGPAD